ncbi:hypothetical protein [Micrococcoides hystricis]|uniref:Uncharacterized protein n=1 Tax=Micrococcoides hystricis TaxID=1572761 RepID=A0ABV6P833_9MICC
MMEPSSYPGQGTQPVGQTPKNYNMNLAAKSNAHQRCRSRRDEQGRWDCGELEAYEMIGLDVGGFFAAQYCPTD